MQKKLDITGIALLVHELDALLHGLILLLLIRPGSLVFLLFDLDLVLQIADLVLHHTDRSHVLGDLFCLLCKLLRDGILFILQRTGLISRGVQLTLRLISLFLQFRAGRCLDSCRRCEHAGAADKGRGQQNDRCGAPRYSFMMVERKLHAYTYAV